MMNNLSISHQGDLLAYDQLNLRLAQQSFEESRTDRIFNSVDRNKTIENVEAYSINLDMVKSIGYRHELFYGAEYIINDVKSNGSVTDINTGIESIGPSRYPISTWSSIAAYVTDEFKLAKKMTLQMGLRYNQFILESDFSNNQSFYPFKFNSASLNQGSLTGSAGAVYRATEKLIFRTNFGTAFRSPNVDDMGKIFDSEPGAVTVPNPKLNAEYAYNADLGVAKVFGDFLKLDVTAYYTILNKAMVRRDFQLNGQDSIIYEGVLSKVQAIQNAAVANVYGIQAGFELKLPAGFTILSDLNYQKGEEELDDGTISASRHAAPLFGISRLRYKYKDLMLEVNSQYQGLRKFADLAKEEQSKDEIYAKDANGNNYSPSWYTLNFKANYQLNDLLLISTGIENLTDQRYRSYSSGISGAGRNYILSLSAYF
jgi:hemoglobin/transferrin/lactoferrin receptor protein